MDTRGAIKVLNRLYRTTRAGEMGFNTVSGVVRNRGLKVLLKSFAQRRRQMADELVAEIERLGGAVTDRRSFPGMVHRGRVAIVGTMIINEDRTTLAMLKEASVGEDAAMRRYRWAMDKDLPAETQSLLQSHLAAIEKTAATIEELRGQEGERLIVRMFDSRQQATNVLAAMADDNLGAARHEISELDEMTLTYQGETAVVSEVVISGGVGGGLWGGLLGTFAGAGLVIGAGISPMIAANPMSMWAMIVLLSLLSGAVIGGILGLFIGVGFVEEDAHLYNHDLAGGEVLLMLHTSEQQASAAVTMLHRLSVQARSGALKAA